MANTKITDLTAYTDPVSTDVLPIVDVGADITKKVSIADIMENAGSGTEATPGISFDGDPNTGIYSPGADQVAISTGGSGRLFVDASGRVGVGATPAAVNFEVSQSGTASASDVLRIYNRTDGTSTGYLGLPKYGSTASAYGPYSANNVGINAVFTQLNIGTETAHDLAAYTNNIERLRITSDGKVGVGTSSPASSLHIAGSNPAVRVQDTDGTNQFGIFYKNGAATTFYSQNDTTNGSFHWVQNDGTTSTTSMVLNSAGSLGIGTSSVTNSLHVVGTGDAVARLAATSDTNLTFSETTANKHWNIKPSAGDFYVQYSGTAYNSGYSSLVTIKDTGAVGIGTTSPLEKLHVVGGGARVDGTFNVNGTSCIGLDQWSSNESAIRAWGSSGNNGSIHFRIGSGGSGDTERLRIDSSGRLLVGTSTAASTQDGNIQVLTAACVRRNVNTAGGPALRLEKTRGTVDGDYTTVSSGDVIGEVQFYGSNGTELLEAASISAVVDGAPGAADMPGAIVLSTSPDGTAVPTEAFRITNDNVICYIQSDPISKAAAATLTVAELKNGIIRYTGAAATLTLPTGTLMDGGFSNPPLNLTFEWSVINTGTGTATIAAGTGHTIIGVATVALSTAGRFATRRTAANTYVSYRISS